MTLLALFNEFPKHFRICCIFMELDTIEKNEKDSSGKRISKRDTCRHVSDLKLITQNWIKLYSS